MLFHETTQTILDWIQQQPHVKEESITDWLLFELSKRYRCLKYYTFTRHEEMSNGADWEWWVLTTHFAYRFRVQAKKLKAKIDNYSSVCYSNNNGLQIDLLLEASDHDAAFPLYMFYSAGEQDTDLVLRNYPTPNLSKMIKWCEPCSNGAYLSPARVIYDEVLAKPKRKIDDSTLLNISLKLSCFDLVFQHSDVESINSEVEKHLNLLNRSFKQESKHGFRYQYDGNTANFQYGTVPHWLSYMIGEKQSNIELSDWFEGEFRNQLPNVAGVIVLDLRQEL